MAKKSDQISVRMTPELRETLSEIEERHGITAPEIARRCLEQVAQFYDTHGWFGFPLRIEPPRELLERMLAANPSLQFTPPKATKRAKKETDPLSGTVIFKK